MTNLVLDAGSRAQSKRLDGLPDTIAILLLIDDTFRRLPPLPRQTHRTRL